MSSSSEAGSIVERLPGRRLQRGEVVLLCCSVLSLLASCILWSSHKQAWMDEIFTWKEVSDPSLWHLYYAIQHGADGGQPLFYTTAWFWAKAFGFGVLALRLYSCVAMCGALLVTWRTIRRFYGMWATAFGVLFSGALRVCCWSRTWKRASTDFTCWRSRLRLTSIRDLVARPGAHACFCCCFFSQAALVLTHVLGLIYGGLILLALILFDAAKGRLRWKLYLCLCGRLAGAPGLDSRDPIVHGGGQTAWLDRDANHNGPAHRLPFCRFPDRGSGCLSVIPSKRDFRSLAALRNWIIYVPLAVVFLLGVRRICGQDGEPIADPRGALLLVAYILFSAPVVLFLLSHLITPVFVPRYFLPSGIGFGDNPGGVCGCARLRQAGFLTLVPVDVDSDSYCS